MVRNWIRIGSLLICLAVTQAAADDLKINTDSSNKDQIRPALSMNRYGKSVLVWSDDRNGHYDIYGQLFTEKGHLAGENFRINDDPGEVSQGDPQVAMNVRGWFIVVWIDERNGDSDIYGQWYAANGIPVGANFRINDDAGSEMQYYPDVAMDAQGNAVVCWLDDRMALERRVFKQRFDANGIPLGVNTVVSPGGMAEASFTAVGMNASGASVVTWSAMEPAGGEVYFQRFDAAGMPLGESVHVTTAADQHGGALLSDVAVDAFGNFMVTWHEAKPGNFLAVAARCFDDAGYPRGSLFYVNTVMEGMQNQSPAVAPIFTGGYQLSWGTTKDGSWDVYTQPFDVNGVALEPSHRVNHHVPAQQSTSTVGLDNRGIMVFAWHDNRNGNYDIYAQWEGPRVPLNLTAGSGFDEKVPLTWDPIYGDTETRSYTVYRSTTSGGPYSAITTVNLADRPLPNLMMDWIDNDVQSYKTYFYVVESNAAESEGFSREACAQVHYEDPQLYSPWAFSPPAIDGILSHEEWRDANTAHIANPFADSAITLYIMNDALKLYLAVDDPNDHLIDPMNLLGILFDEANDGLWPAAGPSTEGALFINQGGAGFAGYWGAYPNGLRADPLVPAPGILSRISSARGHVQYEVAIDWTTSPLVSHPNGKLGIAIWIDDPGHFYPFKYGNAAEWPSGALWESAATLGDLCMAENPGEGLYTNVIASDRFIEDIAAADLDQNGVDELLVLSNSSDDDYNGVLQLFRWDGTTFREQWHSSTMNGYPYGSQITDLDGDGRMDALVACGGVQFFRNAEESLTGPILILNEELDENFALHDWDGDGLTDLIGGSPYYGHRKLEIYRQDPTHSRFTFVDTLEATPGNNMVHTGDFDNDGRIDLLSLELYSGSVTVLRNLGGFEFSEMFSMDFSGDRVFDGVVSDLDKDGYDDFAVQAGYGSTVHVFKNNRNGTFSEVAVQGALEQGSGQLALCDIDQDGFSDMLAGSLNGDMHLILNDKSFVLYDIPANRAVGDQLFSLAAGDFDGDGQTDFAMGMERLNVMTPALRFFDISVNVDSPAAQWPQKPQLLQNYPNPFNAETRISFIVPQPGRVEIELFDLLGRKVRTLTYRHYAKGAHSIMLNAADLASGIYFYRIKCDSFRAIRKMLLIE